MVTLLSDIIESDAQAALLGFLLVAPLRTFSAKELVMRLHLSSEKFDKAVAELVEQNYIKRLSVTGTKLFMLNMRHPHIPPMRQELLKHEKSWPDELFSSLKKLGQLSSIFLSGIFVGQPQLPVDLLLVGKVNLTKLDEFLKHAQKFFGRELNYSIMTAEEFIDRRDTFDRFIKDIFDYPHLVVIDQAKPSKKGTKKK